MKAVTLSLLFLLLAAGQAKIFSKCELASFLKKRGLDGYHGQSLENWVCLAFYVSNYNSRLVGGKRTDGNYSYGIFQINSLWWCNNDQGPTSNGCRKPCSAFMDDDITDDIACAKRILRGSKSMEAWVGWQKNCRGKNLSGWTQGCKL